MPNQLLTSSESVKFIEEAVDRVEKKEKIKQEKDDFCKKVLAQKMKMERAGKNNRGGVSRVRGIKMIEFVNPIDVTANLIQIFH